jgi:trimeric autotransporter adhesin
MTEHLPKKIVLQMRFGIGLVLLLQTSLGCARHIWRFPMRSLLVSIFTLQILLVTVPSTSAQEGLAQLSALPAVAQSNISAALGRDNSDYKARIAEESIHFENLRQRIGADFADDGVTLNTAKTSWRLVFVAYGHGDALEPVGKSQPTAENNRVTYRHGAVTEWYVNGPLGLEQGFTINQSPADAASQPLTISLAVGGDVRTTINPDGTSATFSDLRGQPLLRYSGLAAYDAKGKELNAWLEPQNGRLNLQIVDAGAHYPIVVDPVMELATLTASDGNQGDVFGAQVAISGDTVAVGAPEALGSGCINDGAIYVFVKPASGWQNMTQTAKLTSSSSCMLSLFAFKGDTIVGGQLSCTGNGNFGPGAIYVFVKPAGGWSNMQPTAVLADGNPGCVDSFALSAAINDTQDIIVAGRGPKNNIFAFVKPAGGWTSTNQATFSLTGPPGSSGFGNSLAIRSNLLAVGAPNTLPGGAVYVFQSSPSGGLKELATLTESNAQLYDHLGSSLAMTKQHDSERRPASAVESRHSVRLRGAAHWLDEHDGNGAA